MLLANYVLHMSVINASGSPTALKPTIPSDTSRSAEDSFAVGEALKQPLVLPKHREKGTLCLLMSLPFLMPASSRCVSVMPLYPQLCKHTGESSQ
jgi:hypothetical protein